MTRKISVKQTFRQALAVFLDDIKKCRTPLILFTIIAVFFTTAILALALVKRDSGLSALLFAQKSAMQLFYTGTAVAIFLLTSVFALIYCFKVFSYLHNKRKADKFAPMPMKASAMLLTKAASAFFLAIIPALFFIGIISIVTAIGGVSISGQILAFLWQIPLGALACVAFYALMAVCCGTSANTVMTFLAINFSYPVAASYVKSMLYSFFIGIPTNLRNEHVLMKALNTFAAYDGMNVVYWLVFSAVCLAAAVLLLRHRKAERAQTSFVYRLPCYIVEVLISFIAGMIMGVLFAGNEVTGNAFWGFVFGFLLGGATAFVVAHVILFRGFKRIIKSLIFFGAMCAAGIAFTSVCCFASDGYTAYIPNKSDIVSAGFIEFYPNMLESPRFADVTGTIKSSAGDFDDEESISAIYNSHSAIVKAVKKRDAGAKFRSMTANTLTDTMYALFGHGDNHFSYAYRLKDGSTVTRYYSMSDLLNPIYSDNSIFNDQSLSDAISIFPGSNLSSITSSSAYIKKYDTLRFTTADDLEYMSLFTDNSMFWLESDGSEKKDMEKIFRAFREDYIEFGAYEEYDTEISIMLYRNETYGSNRSPLLLSVLQNPFDYSSLGMNDSYGIPESYKRTIQALKDVGILTEDGSANQKSPYCSDYSSLVDYDDEYISDTEIFDDAEGVYQRGDHIAVGDSVLKLPFDCEKKTENGLAAYYNKDGELLMFQTLTMPGESNAGKAEKNAFADKFELVKQQPGDDMSFCGTATVKADGKEMSLRYLIYGNEEEETLFLTEKLDDTDYQNLQMWYENYY